MLVHVEEHDQGRVPDRRVFRHEHEPVRRLCPRASPSPAARPRSRAAPQRCSPGRVVWTTRRGTRACAATPDPERGGRGRAPVSVGPRPLLAAHAPSRASRGDLRRGGAGPGVEALLRRRSPQAVKRQWLRDLQLPRLRFAPPGPPKVAGLTPVVSGPGRVPRLALRPSLSATADASGRQSGWLGGEGRRRRGTAGHAAP